MNEFVKVLIEAVVIVLAVSFISLGLHKRSGEQRWWRRWYVDPVDGSRSSGQGIRILLEDDARIIYRLSGTGTAGAMLRVYIEALEDDPARQGMPAQQLLEPLIAQAGRLAGIRERLGVDRPTVIT